MRLDYVIVRSVRDLELIESMLDYFNSGHADDFTCEISPNDNWIEIKKDEDSVISSLFQFIRELVLENSHAIMDHINAMGYEFIVDDSQLPDCISESSLDILFDITECDSNSCIVELNRRK